MQNLSSKGNGVVSLLRRETFLFLACAAIILTILALVFVNPLRVNRDASLHLLIGRLLLGGAVPYVDYVEINPPLVHYLHVVPVALAGWIGVNPIPLFLLIMLVLTVWSVGCAVYLLARNLEVEGYLVGGIVAFAVAILDLKLFTTNEFGQREHIFFLLVLPYVILRWLRRRGELTRGNRLALVVGATAGIGTFIKPHFLLIVVGLEVFWSFAEGGLLRQKKSELVSLLGVGVAYALLLLLMPKEMREGLLAVVKSVLAGGYRAYGDQSPIGLILDQDILLLLGLAPFLFLRVRANRNDVESLILTMSVFLLTSLVVYGSQARGFAYHLIPAMAAAYLVVFLVIFSVAPRFASIVWDNGGTRGNRPTARGRFGWLLTTTLVLIVVGKWIGDLSPNAIRGTASLPDANIVAAISDNSSEDDGVLVVSTMAEPFRYVLQADRRLASKYIPTNPISFGVSGIHDVNELYDPAYVLPESVQAYLNELEASIARDRPALIIIDNRKSCVGCPAEFQVTEFLRGRGVYAAVIASRYTLLLTSERIELYKRRG